MSSTNRGSVRNATDYYVTPQWAIREFLYVASREESIAGMFRPDHSATQLRILDPCAGGDAEGMPMAYPKSINESGYFPLAHNITTLDIREDSPACIHTDFLTWQPTEVFDLAITNPPFCIAEQVIEKALTCVRHGGFVVMLARLNFFGSQFRVKFWKNRMPIYTYVHAKRMRFIEGSQGDSIEYCHLVWKVGEHRVATNLEVIYEPCCHTI